MNIFNKLKFFLKKPKVIILTGNDSFFVKEYVFQILNQYPQAMKEVLLLENDFHDFEKNKFLINKSSLFILAITGFKDLYEKDEEKGFSSPHLVTTREVKKIYELIKKRSNQSSSKIILNFDDKIVKEMIDGNNFNILTFGFNEEADFCASDVMLLNEETNFKINYKGSTVPIWLNGLFDKNKIYSVLSAICVGVILGLNLVEISQALRNK